MAIQLVSDVDLTGTVDVQGELQLDGSAGTTGQLLESQGPSATPGWGRTITASTSDPSGGSDGDIWIKYTA